jgi:hypothetical protein
LIFFNTAGRIWFLFTEERHVPLRGAELSCLFGLSACTEKETVYDAEDIAGMLMAFCTRTRIPLRTYLAAMETYEPPSSGRAESGGRRRRGREAGPDCFRLPPRFDPLSFEGCLEAVVSSRMLLRLDKSAAAADSSVVPTEVTVEEDKETAGKCLFTVFAVTTRSDGTETETQQSGCFVLRDGRVQELSFSGGDGFFDG